MKIRLSIALLALSACHDGFPPEDKPDDAGFDASPPRGAPSGSLDDEPPGDDDGEPDVPRDAGAPDASPRDAASIVEDASAAPIANDAARSEPPRDAGTPDAAKADVTVDAGPSCAYYVPRAGDFTNVYDPSPSRSEPWYFTSHHMVRGPNDTWHLFGTTHAEPAIAEEELDIGHAVAMSPRGPWTRLPPALHASPAYGETEMWGPHVIENEGTYYMFYCGGGAKETEYQIELATSTDMMTWTREPKPLFKDGYQARDPFVMKIGGRWVMYYTATSDPEGGAFIVAYRTSLDLRTWSERQTAYTDFNTGMWGGTTQSPSVIKRDEGYYLAIGPRDDYSRVAFLFSRDPLHFSWPPVGDLISDVMEYVAEPNGNEWITSAGRGANGVWLAPLTWSCAPGK